MKDKTTTALLAFFLGGIGAHRFYLGQTGLGFAYLIFCWTFIPACIALFDFVCFLLMSTENFNRKYNSNMHVAPQINAPQFTNQIINNYTPHNTVADKDITSEIERLYILKERGIITQTDFDEAKRKLI
ncbi:NINE protein [Sphingobacterium sp. lm-10]|uniref:NINE protein n=1 Tax=Sphingobacterium sp. lm-10 TaxID=2944904 RepID=UPI002021E28D|nr:NINE protein [Sphingobacterium sp. lm-10]MCL7987605.1 NINE protein [Sphingobacterium sp. lm-10]